MSGSYTVQAVVAQAWRASSDSIIRMSLQLLVRPAKLLFLVFSLAAVISGYGIQASRGPHARAAAAVSILRWEPARLVNGSPCLFQVRPGVDLKSLTGTWFGHTVYFDLDPSRTTWSGFAGTGVETEAGTYTLALEGVTARGTPFNAKELVRVGKAAYPSIALRVPGQFTAPDPETVARIERERDFKNKIFEMRTPERMWSGNFTAPVGTSTTDSFGTQRKFNGVLKSVHHGLDFHALTGTPVAAVNSGKVVVARSLFGEGNCVMIDHGQGLLTIYMHLSDFKVHEGDSVTRGQVVGLSGGTGRATAPHLHLGVRWQGVYVDPAALLRLKLPGA